MNVRQQREFHQRKVLRDAGWDVPQRDSVAFNAGSETRRHFVCKCIVADVMKDRGYRIASEVEKEGTGEIDVVAYGTEDPPLAIECETSPTDAVVSDKLERYVYGEPYRDMLLIDVDDLPETIPDAYAFVQGEL